MASSVQSCNFNFVIATKWRRKRVNSTIVIPSWQPLRSSKSSSMLEHCCTISFRSKTRQLDGQHQSQWLLYNLHKHFRGFNLHTISQSLRRRNLQYNLVASTVISNTISCNPLQQTHCNLQYNLARSHNRQQTSSLTIDFSPANSIWNSILYITKYSEKSDPLNRSSWIENPVGFRSRKSGSEDRMDPVANYNIDVSKFTLIVESFAITQI